MRILITGASGFVGGHLVEALLRHGSHTIQGLSRHPTWPSEWRHLADHVVFHSVDLLDTNRTETILREADPQWVFHLAGYANAGKSFHESDSTWRSNLDATRSLYDAVIRWGKSPRILFTSSGLVYGDSGPGEQLCSEDSPFKPASPYAASKAAAELLSYQVTRSPGLDVIRVRCFNQIGPGQTPDYAVANFARQIAAIEAGKQAAILETGDLSGQRDFTDVRDMVQAYLRLMEVGRTGEVYNAGSGSTHRIQTILDLLIQLSRVPVEVRQRVDPHRKADTTVSRADIRKLQHATGWKPTYTLEQTLADTLNFWRDKTSRGE